MSSVPYDRVHATLYSQDGKAKIAWLAKATNIEWLDRNRGASTYTFEVPLDRLDGTADPVTALIDRRMIVKFTVVYRGYPIAVLGCRLQSRGVELVRDGTRWLRFESQPGLTAMPADAVIAPEYGWRDDDADDTRWFGWMSADGNWRIDHRWHLCRGYRMSAETGHRKGHPSGLRHYNPMWISLENPATHVAPGTTRYLRTRTGHFDLAAPKHVQLAFAFDNFGDLWLDGRQIMQHDPHDPFAWQHIQSVKLHLDAGAHVIAIRNRNVATAAGGASPMGVIGNVFELDSEAKIVGVLLETNTTDWVVHASSPEPGWHRAQVIRQGMLEAQGRGAHGPNRLTLGFTDFHDSHGYRWLDRGVYNFPIGTAESNLASVIQQLAEHELDAWVDARSMVLHAARRRGRDRSATVEYLLGDDPSGDGTLKSHQAQTAAPTATVAYTRAADRQWVKTVDAAAVAEWGVIETGLALGSVSEATGAKIAQRHLARLARALTYVSSQSAINAGPIPYKDFQIGDTIRTPAGDPWTTMKSRVLGIGGRFSADQASEGGELQMWPLYREDTVS